MIDNTKQYIECKPLIYGKNIKEEYAITKKMAFENKKHIGGEYEKIILP